MGLGEGGRLGRKSGKEGKREVARLPEGKRCQFFVIWPSSLPFPYTLQRGNPEHSGSSNSVQLPVDRASLFAKHSL